MGTTTNGQLSYGIKFEEGFEFPWDAEPWNGDHENWWKDMNGFENPHESPFTAQGNWREDLPEGEREKLFTKWNKFISDWEDKNPFPVTLVNYCSDNCEMFILAVKGFENRRGYPMKIEPADILPDAVKGAELIKFCRDYDIDFENGPEWYLSSYWG